MSRLDKQLERLKERKAAVAQELKEVEAKARAQERKRDTRRKVLVGAYVLELVERGDFDETALQAGLDDYLTKPSDRELFDLPPLDTEETVQAATTSRVPPTGASQPVPTSATVVRPELD